MKKLVICSGKGGVGKTTLTVGIAKMLSSSHQVGILDVDIDTPNLPEMMNVKERNVELSEEGIVPMIVDGIEMMSVGLMLDADMAVMWTGDRRAMAIDQLINKVDWKCDVLVIDTPPGTTDEVMMVIKKFSPDGIIIVTTNHRASIADVRRTLTMIDLLGAKKKIVGIIKNMTYVLCAKCGEKNALFDDEEDENINKLVIAEVPYINTDNELNEYLIEAILKIEEVL